MKNLLFVMEKAENKPVTVNPKEIENADDFKELVECLNGEANLEKGIEYLKKKNYGGEIIIEKDDLGWYFMVPSKEEQKKILLNTFDKIENVVQSLKKETSCSFEYKSESFRKLHCLTEFLDDVLLYQSSDSFGLCYKDFIAHVECGVKYYLHKAYYYTPVMNLDSLLEDENLARFNNFIEAQEDKRLQETLKYGAWEKILIKNTPVIMCGTQSTYTDIKESIIEDLENQTSETIYKIVERETDSLQEIFGKSIEQLLDEDFSSFKEDYFKGERIFIEKIREQNKNLELKIDNFFVSTIESANYIKRIDKFGLLKLRKKIAELAGEEVLNHYLNGEELKALNLEKEELKTLCQNYDLDTFKLDDKYRTIEKDQRAKADAIEYDITKSAKTVKRRKKKKDQGEITGVNGVLQFIYGYTHEGKLDSLACTSLYRIIENYDDDEVYARDENNPDCLTFDDFKRIVEDGIETGKGLLWD